MSIVLSLAAIFFLLVGNELWRKRRASHSEHHRKLIHIGVGTFVAFWPLYMSWNVIRLISIAFLVGVLISRSLKIFASIHEVERFSLGEVCFALAVGTLTFITKADWIYIACLLQMSLADGMAAIVGLHWGKHNSYRVFTAKKSIAGTTAFFVTSLTIFLIAKFASAAVVPIWVLLVASLIATLVENIALYGLDDLFLPVIAAVILTRL